MCGIIAIAGKAPVRARLMDGLRRMEYRGYDSAGLALVVDGVVERRRAVGKLVELETVIAGDPVDAHTGLGHTRWATHGAATVANAHPHAADAVAIVHNGIIENFADLRLELEQAGRTFASQTDSETVAHLLADARQRGLSHIDAVSDVLGRLRGAFGLAIVFADQPDTIIGARRGSPLVVGYGDGETYLGSDALGLAALTGQITYLEEGDWVIATPRGAEFRDASGARVTRPVVPAGVSAAMAEKGSYRHFMEKEIHEQPDALSHTIGHYVDPAALVARVPEGLAFARISRLMITACGTANYAGQIAKYWMEEIARLATEVDIASELRYRSPVLDPDGAAIAITQSGETADTKAAFELCLAGGMTGVALVNVASSTIARMAHVVAPTLAGPEIGVASTKAFSSQLAALACLTVGAARARGAIDADREHELVRRLIETPRLVARAIEVCDVAARQIAPEFAKVSSALFLGRGPYSALALEGALKLKEISYIHAEGYPAGELKHGPIALVDEDTPVIVLAPSGPNFEKTASNVQEVAARGGPVTLITDARGAPQLADVVSRTIILDEIDPFVAPIVYAIPVQLLAYHTAVAKGTDVDQPRNLAKSVTVE